MAFSNGADLKAEIAAHLDRTDLTAYIPDFMTIFETTANTELELRTRYNTVKTTLTLGAGGQNVTLPSDFLEAKTFIDTTPVPVTVLPILTPASLYTTANTPTVAGPPKGVTIRGLYAEFSPQSDQSRAIDLYYYQAVTPLTDTTTNWLLTYYPSLYLYGSLISAEAFLGTDQRLEIWGQIYDTLRLKIGGATERGQYGGSPVRVQVDNAV